MVRLQRKIDNWDPFQVYLVTINVGVMIFVNSQVDHVRQESKDAMHLAIAVLRE